MHGIQIHAQPMPPWADTTGGLDVRSDDLADKSSIFPVGVSIKARSMPSGNEPGGPLGRVQYSH